MHSLKVFWNNRGSLFFNAILWLNKKHEYLGQRLATNQYMNDFKAVIFFYLVVKLFFFFTFHIHIATLAYIIVKLTSSLWNRYFSISLSPNPQQRLHEPRVAVCVCVCEDRDQLLGCRHQCNVKCTSGSAASNTRFPLIEKQNVLVELFLFLFHFELTENCVHCWKGGNKNELDFLISMSS